MSAALPVAFAVFVWWFSTGLVLWLDGLPRTTFGLNRLLSSLLALFAFAGIAHAAQQTGAAAAYCGFVCALLVWGWHELSFLTGWVTGPRRHAASAEAGGWRRFVQALQAILWHELGILGSGIAIAWLSWGQPNQVAAATFAVLWLMRISAKLNVFLGVRNLSVELLPAHLAYLGSYFRCRPMNALFPWAVLIACGVTVLIVRAALQAPAGSAEQVGAMLVSTLLILAIVEHALLVLPVDATGLWRWALRDRTPPQAALLATPVLPASAIESDDKLLHAR